MWLLLSYSYDFVNIYSLLLSGNDTNITWTTEAPIVPGGQPGMSLPMHTFNSTCETDSSFDSLSDCLFIYYIPRNEVRGVYWIHPVCLSVCPSVRLSVCPLTFRVRPVASTVQDGFFPYLAQMITSMRGCVAYDDLWPWAISSRSFGLGLENRVRSVASTVPDGFFPYLVQMITSMRRCVACDGLWPWPISSRSFELDF